MLETEKTLELFFSKFPSICKMCWPTKYMITYAEHGHFNMSTPLHRTTMG